MTTTNSTDVNGRVSSGIAGLDEVLLGGFVPRRAYLVRGGPGAGKTTLGLHFLTTGSAKGEKTLFINLGETSEQIRGNAASTGFDLSNVAFVDLSPTPEFFTQVQSYDVFSPAEVEREPTTDRITAEIKALKPQRVFLDAMSHLRYLSSDSFQFRRQVLSLLRFLVEQGATVVFTSEVGLSDPDDDLQYMADGIIELRNAAGRRTLLVNKFRGSDFRSGEHAMRLGAQGMKVFTRIMPDVSHHEFSRELLPSGVPELDDLLHGGLERGTITIITGPTGVGKTTLGLQYMKEAAARGEHSTVYTFEEAAEALLARSEAINIPLKVMAERGTLDIALIEPLHFTPDEFAHLVRRDVEERGTRIVMIDSISGYRLSLQGEDIVSHLHALCKYLQNVGVAVILINEIEEITGNFRVSEISISYIADNIIFLRYLEIKGELHRAIGVLKKRLSNFEKTLREYEITHDGIKVGRPLTELRGILSGMPSWDDTPTADRHDR